jgi:hypothetical protein
LDQKPGFGQLNNVKPVAEQVEILTPYLAFDMDDTKTFGVLVQKMLIHWGIWCTQRGFADKIFPQSEQRGCFSSIKICFKKINQDPPENFQSKPD